MAVTIKHVAEAAGVSVSTVSYTLNNSGAVSQEKRLKVMEAVKTLGYVPNGMAKSLKMKKNGFIGYFAYSLYGVVYGEVLRGIENEMDKHDQEMIAARCGRLQSITHISCLLRERMVDGAIVFSETIPNEVLSTLADTGCPVVVLDRELSGPRISSVLIDNVNSAFRVGEYIHSLGLRKVACLFGDGYDGQKRLLGLKEAVGEFGLSLPDHWCVRGNWEEDHAYQETIKFIRKGNRPEVIFALNDEMAMGCIRALRDMLIRVPEDISVIGMDDIAASSLFSPSLTTVHRPLYELGEMAAKTLLDMMNGGPSSKIILPTALVQRESCIKHWAI